MSSLQAVKGFKLELNLVYQSIKDYSHLTESGKRIVVCWIPSHVNITGNERADLAAKSAVTLHTHTHTTCLTALCPGLPG